MSKLVGFEKPDGKRAYIDPDVVTAVIDNSDAAGTVAIHTGEDIFVVVKGTADDVAKAVNAGRS
jgi:hypothetical protein